MNHQLMRTTFSAPGIEQAIRFSRSSHLHKRRIGVLGLLFTGLIAASTGAFATTSILSISLADPTTLSLGNSQHDIAVTSLTFTAGLVPHFTGDASVYDQNGYNFSISSLETGTMLYTASCGRYCSHPNTLGTWTQGVYDPFSNSYSPIRSTSVDMFSPGDVLDATFNFVIPGGPKASSLPFVFSFLVTGTFTPNAYVLQMTDTTTGSVITPSGGIYSLGPDSYALHFSAMFNAVGSGITLTTSAAAVPEAATYAMMLAGLGLLGMNVGRRRANLK